MTPVLTKTVQSARLDTQDLLERIMQDGGSMALWRLPDEEKISLVLSKTSRKLSDIQLETLPPGFLISPFRPEREKIFIPTDCIAQCDPQGSVSDVPESPCHLQAFLNTPAERIHTATPHQPEPSPDPTRPDFLDLADKCLQSIRSGQTEKIVPALRKTVPIPEDLRPADLFFRLISAYPHAMVSLVYTPDTGLWIGATPEPLISTDRNGIFRTVALAGTKQFDPNVPEQAVTWTQKEIEEQALVERYIINCFKTIRLREYEEFGPKTYRAGNLLHLRSVFEVNLQETAFPDLGSVMLRLLHPTSAVCGMPRQAALDFLQAHEAFDRELFAGYLGPVNVHGEIRLFVNLRCMKWSGDHAQLFAGAGVTGSSVPESEWRECELKTQTILRFLQTALTV